MVSDVSALIRDGFTVHANSHSLDAAQAAQIVCFLVARGVACPDRLTLTGFGPPPPQYDYGLNKELIGVPAELYRNSGDCVTRHPIWGNHVSGLILIGPEEDERNRFLDHRIAKYIEALPSA